MDGFYVRPGDSHLPNLLQRLLGRPQKVLALRPPRARPEPPPLRYEAYRVADHDWNVAYEAIGLSRQRFWRRMGALDADALDIDPAITAHGGREWPTMRRRLMAIRRASTLIVTTDGLSDPFTYARGDGIGYRMEMFVEVLTPLPSLVPDPCVQDDLARSWIAEVLVSAAGSAIAADGIRDDIAQFGLVTSEVPDALSHWSAAQLPQRFFHADGSLGLVFGVPARTLPPEITDPRHPPVTLVSVGLLTAAELDAARRRDRGFRRALREHLAGHGGHLINFDRPSFV